MENDEALIQQKVSARVRSFDRVAQVPRNHCEVCFGCKGSGKCDCPVCKGTCGACKGTGYLCWIDQS